MLGRRRKLPLFENVTITEVAAEGKALARIDNMVVFVTGLVPGDVADIQIKKKRKKYMEGIPVQIHEYSKDRTDPFCSHFGTCGGCKWQHLPYDKQKFYKQKQVEDNLVRLGKLDVPEVTPILGAEKVQCYRNKLEYTFSALK
ncbi:MAG: TRAM domain-containing protein, partial [Bacteroidales bacterium]|nr:TRAM domain-containing protein [Bacteroidales bacterium]